MKLMFFFCSLLAIMLLSGCIASKKVEHVNSEIGIEFYCPKNYNVLPYRKNDVNGLVLFTTKRLLEYKMDDSDFFVDGILIDEIDYEFFRMFYDYSVRKEFKEKFENNYVYNLSNVLIASNYVPPKMYVYYFPYKKKKLWRISAPKESNTQDYYPAILEILKTIKVINSSSTLSHELKHVKGN